MRDRQLESRQHAGVVREQAVFAIVHVPESVGEQKCVAVLEREPRQ